MLSSKSQFTGLARLDALIIVMQQDKKDVCKGPFLYYVITFLGFWDPPPPLPQHGFSTKNKQKLAFSDPPSPYKC